MSLADMKVQLLVQIPECPEVLADLYLKNAVNRVLEEVDALTKWLVPLKTKEGLRKYPLDLCAEKGTLKAIRKVELEGVALRGWKSSNGYLILADEPSEGQMLRIKVALRYEGGDLPDTLGNFENGLVAWALWHLLRIQHQLWFNPQLADDYRREYLRDKQTLEDELNAAEANEGTAIPMLSNPYGFV
ncbi:MAG: hypothetical protein ACH34X_18290 [Thiolinea sp.]